MTNPNAPINSIPDLTKHPSTWIGLTKREYFAAMAMQGYISCREFDNLSEEQLAMCSVVQADALIKALNESKPTEK